MIETLIVIIVFCVFVGGIAGLAVRLWKGGKELTEAMEEGMEDLRRLMIDRYVHEQGIKVYKQLSSGELLIVFHCSPFCFHLCKTDKYIYGIFQDVFYYSTRERANQALSDWKDEEGYEPDGWFYHPRTGRTRPNGDKSREYVEE